MIFTRIQEALRFWWSYLIPLLIVTAPFALTGEIVKLWQGPALQFNKQGQFVGLTTISALTLAVLQPLSQAALIARLDAIEKGVPRNLGDCLLVSARVAPMLMLTYILLGIGVYIGLLLLILPGIWLYIRLCLAPFVITLEKPSPIHALRTSFERTAGITQWQLLGGLLFLAVLLFGVVSLVGRILQSTLGTQPLAQIALAVLATLASTLLSILVFRFYGLTKPNGSDSSHD